MVAVDDLYLLNSRDSRNWHSSAIAVAFDGVAFEIVVDLASSCCLDFGLY